MDPNETLRLIRMTIKQMEVDEHPGIYKAHAQELAGYFTNLDEWISRGGFLPGDWAGVPALTETCTAEHGDWTGPHVRIGSCPIP